MKYKFLEHTADAKFQAFGKSLEEAFSNAALAMVSIMVDSSKIKPKIKKKIKVEGKDLKALLYNFLEEILFLLDTKGFLLNKVKELKIKRNKLSAVLIGDKINKEYQTIGEVKAVTYNDMEISFSSKENLGKENAFMVQVVVDL